MRQVAQGPRRPATDRAAAAGALLAGALLLLWPAALNGYPLLFSDTGAFLAQTTVPLMIWDKPWIYGPLLHLFHWEVSLWLPLAAQGLLLSHLLWLTQRAVRGRATAPLHLLLSAGTAVFTTAPWSAALLMPDILAPVTVLALFLLGFAREALSRAEAWYLGVVATLAIAAHLSHLPVALALAVLVLLVTRRRAPALRAVAPLGAALLLLVVTNGVGHGRPSVSPFGATFALARLQADGPAARLIRARCPAAGWYLCAFDDLLPMDSDRFLWAPDSPVNRDGAGRPRFLGGMLLAPEAAEIVGATLREYPIEVLGLTLWNGARQLVLAEAGDTLGPDHLAAAVRVRIAEFFPGFELVAYDAAAQPRGVLPDLAAPFLWPHVPVLLAAVPLLLLAWHRAAREDDTRRLGLVLCVLVGVTANALATGGLSKPHHRYEARILWLVPFAAALALLPRRREAPGRREVA